MSEGFTVPVSHESPIHRRPAIFFFFCPQQAYAMEMNIAATCRCRSCSKMYLIFKFSITLKLKSKHNYLVSYYFITMRHTVCSFVKRPSYHFTLHSNTYQKVSNILKLEPTELLVNFFVKAFRNILNLHLATVNPGSLQTLFRLLGYQDS